MFSSTYVGIGVFNKLTEQPSERRMDCEVRIARKWDYAGDQFREVVVNIHAVGNASITMRNHDGKWPVISVN